MAITKEERNRFWEKVDKRNPEDCWLWLAYKDDFGRGKFQLKIEGSRSSARNAARVSWEFTNGPIGDSALVVSHACGVQACVNPAHLKLTTIIEKNKATYERWKNEPSRQD